MTETAFVLCFGLTSYQTSQASLYRALSAGFISILCDSYSTPCGIIHIHQTPVIYSRLSSCSILATMDYVGCTDSCNIQPCLKMEGSSV